MKKTKNKGFTMVELLGVIVILGLLIGVGLMAYSNYVSKTRNEAYEIMVKTSGEAMDSYLVSNSAATEATFKTLYEEELMDPPKDPSDSSKMCRGIVKKEIVKETNKLDENKYKITICCINYIYEYDYTNDSVKITKKTSCPSGAE